MSEPQTINRLKLPFLDCSLVCKEKGVLQLSQISMEAEKQSLSIEKL